LELRMTLVVFALAVVLFVLQRELITGSAIIFVAVLLIPSLAVDLLVLLGPTPEQTTDPMSQYKSSNQRRRRWFVRR
jgi:hypothetical protein